jgi:hypothetical protein
MDTDIRCARCGAAATMYEIETCAWAEVYDPANPELDSILCHAVCIPEGWVTA